MEMQQASYWRRQRLTGLILIGIGSAFLLDRLGVVQLQDLWHYWPLMLVAVGAVRMVDSPTARDVTSGLWTVFVGLWLFANLEGWMGMDFRSSWPALLIAWGITLVLRPILTMRMAGAARAEKEDEHAL